MKQSSEKFCSEKYMRYLIDTYFVPETEQEKEDFNIVMKTHNLIRLMRFLETNLHLTFPIEAKWDMQIINGYYFTARYPGNESIEVTQEDLDLCAQAVQNCRQVIYDFINQMEEK